MRAIVGITQNASHMALPVISATFLLAYVVARRLGMKREFKWVGPAMLLGVWLSGGLFMTFATASGSEFVGVDGVG